MTYTYSSTEEAARQEEQYENTAREKLSSTRFQKRLQKYLRQFRGIDEIAKAENIDRRVVPYAVRIFLTEIYQFDFKKHKKLSKKDEICIGWMLSWGMDAHQIAEVLETNVDFVVRIRKSWDLGYIPPKGSGDKISSEEAASIRAYFYLGYCDGEIAMRFGREVAEIRDFLDKTALAYNSLHRKNRQLGTTDFVVMERLVGMGENITQIAKRLNCDRTTVSKILKRYKEQIPGEFKAENIVWQRNITKHAARGPYRTESRQDFVKRFVSDFENHKESVHSFVNKLYDEREYDKKSKTYSVSSLYRKLHSGEIWTIRKIKSPEPAEGESKKTAKSHGRKRAPFGKPIWQLPEIHKRDGVEDYVYVQMDTFVGSTGTKSSVLTVYILGCELGIARFLKEHTAECVKKELTEIVEVLEKFIPNGIVFILTDNGTEFATVTEIEGLAEKIYNTDPHCPTQKPYIERYNERMREFFEKLKSFDHKSQKDVLEATSKIAQRCVDSLFGCSPIQTTEAFIRRNFGSDTAGADALIKEVKTLVGIES